MPQHDCMSQWWLIITYHHWSPVACIWEQFHWQCLRCRSARLQDMYEHYTLQWCHNEHNGISNHWHLNCLHKRLFRCRSKKTSKICITGLCEGNSPVTGEFPAQMTSNPENISIWWRHHDHHWSPVACTWEQFYWQCWRCRSPRHIYSDMFEHYTFEISAKSPMGWQGWF